MSRSRVRGAPAPAAIPMDPAQHAQVIKDLLVLVNRTYRERFGTPPPPPGFAPLSGGQKDVEMVKV